MNDTIRQDLKNTIASLLEILESKEEHYPSGIRELSDHVIHNASIFQDENSVSLAVIIYAISKIAQRDHERFDHTLIIPGLKKALAALGSEDGSLYRAEIKRLFGIVSKLDRKVKAYIIDVIRQAEIKKGSKIYDHGISMARVSDIMGLSLWELMSYIGKTSIADLDVEPIPVMERLKHARKIFR